MTRKESHQDVLQRQEYERSGAYHRLFLEQPWHPTGLRYILALKLLPDVRGRRCLDLGGGDGAMATLLTDRGGQVVVADPLEVALAHAKADKRLDRTQAGTFMPFETGSFEIVTMLDVVEHIPLSEEPLVLREAFRLLADNGRFVISAPSVRKPNPPGSKHYRHYSRASLTGKLRQAGFAIETAVSWRQLLPGMVGKHLGSIPVGKMARGLAYATDHLVRRTNGRMGLVECLPHQADNLIALARKNSLAL